MNFKKSILALSALTFIACASISCAQKNTESNVSTNPENFTEISASTGVIVNFTQAPNTSINISAPTDLLPYVNAEVKDGKLKCYIKKLNKRIKGDAVINVSAPNIYEIKATTAAVVNATCNAKEMEVEAATAAVINLTTQCTKIEADATTGSIINLKGTAGKAEFEATTGAVINAQSLTVATGEAKGTTGAVINCSMKQLESSKTTTGATINNKK